jgi:hypothetical protein
MKKLLTLSFWLLCFGTAFSQRTIWIETFEDLPVGTTSDAGTTAWTRTTTNANLGSGDYFEVREIDYWNGGTPSFTHSDNRAFGSNNIGGASPNNFATWQTGNINISAYTCTGCSGVNISLDLWETGDLDAGDNVTVSYSLDGGTPVNIFNVTDDPLSYTPNNAPNTKLTVANVFQCGIGAGTNATNLVITVRIQSDDDNGDTETYFFDNVRVSATGLTFTEVAGTAGITVASTDKDGGHTFADLNNDGCLDMFININNNNGRLFLQNLSSGRCAGTFTDRGVDGTTPIFYDQQESGRWQERSVIIADMNNDGYLDLARNSNPVVAIYYNNQIDGTFSMGQLTGTPLYRSHLTILNANTPSPSGMSGFNTEGMTWLDYNLDGWVDLLVDNHNYGTLAYQKVVTTDAANCRTQLFNSLNTTQTGFPTSGFSDGDYMASGDYNDDGKMDFIVRKDGGANDLFTNNFVNAATTPYFSLDLMGSTNFTNADNGDKGGCAFVDLDNDGDLDLIWTSRGDGTGNFNTMIWERTGSTWTRRGTPIYMIYEQAIDCVAFGDVDSDGDYDLYFTNSNINNGAGYLLINNYDPAIPEQNLTFSRHAYQGSCNGITVPGSRNGESCSFVDYDHDGDLDLYVVYNNADNRLYRNNTLSSSSSASARNYMQVRVVMQNELSAATDIYNRTMIGANVTLWDSVLSTRVGGTQTLSGARGHGSQDPHIMYFGGLNRFATYKLVVRYPQMGTLARWTDTITVIPAQIAAPLGGHAFQTLTVARPGEFFGINNPCNDLIQCENKATGIRGPGGVGSTSAGDVLSLWLRGVNISAANGAAISQWDELSGKNNHAVQTSASNRPTYVSSSTQLNNRQAVSFNSSNQSFFRIADGVVDSTILSKTNTIFVVASRNSSSSDQDYALYGSNQTKGTAPAATDAYDGDGHPGFSRYEFNMGFTATGAGKVTIEDNQNTVFSTAQTTSSATGSQPQILTFEYQQDGVSSIYRNAASVGTVVAPKTSVSPRTLLIGGHGSNNTNLARYFDGEIAEIIVYNKKINKAQQRIIENAMAARYGISLATSTSTPTVSRVQSAQSSAGTGSQTATLTSTPTAGNLIVVISAHGGTNPGSGTPLISGSGWTGPILRNEDLTSSTSKGIAIWYKVASSGEPTAYSVNWTSNQHRVMVQEFSVTNGSFDLSGVVSATNEGSAASASTGTTSSSTFTNNLLIGAVGTINTTGTFTSWTNSLSSTIGSSLSSVSLWSGFVLSTTTGPQTSTASYNTSREFVSAIVAIPINVGNTSGTAYNYASTHGEDVAGLGQEIGSCNRQLDAQGPGPVRMWNPTALGNGEYLLWGHNELAMNSNGITNPVDPTASKAAVDGGGFEQVEKRLNRVWRVTETGEIGIVNFSIDLSTVPGNKREQDLRLLVDADGNFSSGSTTYTGTFDASTQIFTVTGKVNFADAQFFTIGSVNEDFTPLPVHLLGFEAYMQGKNARIEWQLENEQNMDYFVVEKSQTGFDWEFVAKVAAQKSLFYHTLDTKPYFGTSYYRLKMVSADGEVEYSKVAILQNDKLTSEHISIFPNPSSGVFNLFISSETHEQKVAYQVFNSSGTEVAFGELLTNTAAQLDMSQQPKGLYILKFGQNESVVVRRIILE